MGTSPEIGAWRLRQQRYQLVGEVCDNCGDKIFPPRDVCQNCVEQGQIKQAQTPFKFSGKGEVWSYSKVYDAPEGYQEQAPYTVAIVKLEEGPLVTAQLTDLEPDKEVQIGQLVEMVTRKLRTFGDKGQIVYGYKFRPRLTSA